MQMRSSTSAAIAEPELDDGYEPLARHFMSAASEQEPAVQQMRRYADTTGLDFLCVDPETGLVLAATSDALADFLPQVVRSQLRSVTGVRIMRLDCGLVYYALPLPHIGGTPTVAVGCVRHGLDSLVDCPNQLQDWSLEAGWSDSDLDHWLGRQKPCHPELLERLLVNAVDSIAREGDLQTEVDRLSVEIEHTYEEISVLHNLTSHLQVSRSPLDLAELCLDRIYQLIEAAGNLVVIDDWKNRRHLLVKGRVPLDDQSFKRLVQQMSHHDWARPLVRNSLAGTLLGADFPGMRNLMLAPITDGTHRSGWLLLCNLPEGREFGVVEASLVSSVATIMATHHRNQELYSQHENLLMQFVSSLISTLDAKDPYTRGHSERVARIALRLGQQLGLRDEDLDDIYQSGLLHDIGKIGIMESVLRKEGGLTDAEFAHIREHPMIGYRILSGLSNLQRVLPGVRNHHEEFSGRGYPDGLAGYDIPMMARIMAVADAYDAMRSDRPYRKGMPLERVEEIFCSGAGQQWDPQVIDAYFQARDDIHFICVQGQAVDDDQ